MHKLIQIFICYISKQTKFEVVCHASEKNWYVFHYLLIYELSSFSNEVDLVNLFTIFMNGTHYVRAYVYTHTHTRAQTAWRTTNHENCVYLYLNKIPLKWLIYIHSMVTTILLATLWWQCLFFLVPHKCADLSKWRQKQIITHHHSNININRNVMYFSYFFLSLAT